MRIKSPKHLLGFVAASQLAGILGSFFTMEAIPTWYATLAKPVFSPPNWVFAPVWIILYALMGIAAYLMWEKGFKKKGVRVGLQWFGIQLLLNALWAPIFFGMKDLFLAFMEIAFLWIAIAMTMLMFWRVDKRAAGLMVPYMLWVSFAAVLNYFLMIMN